MSVINAIGAALGCTFITFLFALGMTFSILGIVVHKKKQKGNTENEELGPSTQRSPFDLNSTSKSKGI